MIGIGIGIPSNQYVEGGSGPSTGNKILAENSNALITESSDNLITES
jgi:hypothetical protein